MVHVQRRLRRFALVAAVAVAGAVAGGCSSGSDGPSGTGGVELGPGVSVENDGQGEGDGPVVGPEDVIEDLPGAAREVADAAEDRNAKLDP